MLILKFNPFGRSNLICPPKFSQQCLVGIHLHTNSKKASKTTIHLTSLLPVHSLHIPQLVWNCFHWPYPMVGCELESSKQLYRSESMRVTSILAIVVSSDNVLVWTMNPNPTLSTWQYHPRIRKIGCHWTILLCSPSHIWSKLVLVHSPKHYS